MNSKDEKNERLIKLISMTALLLITGGLYYLAVVHLGIGIRCSFERLTGYQCPGCGITRMLMSLLNGDIGNAWHYNQLTFALIPFYAVLFTYLGYRYVKHGDWKLPRWANKIIIGIILIYIVFGICRNLA